MGVDVLEQPPAKVTIRDGIHDALHAAGPLGLTMDALSGTVTGSWRARDVEAVVRKLWEVNELARRGDGTFVLTHSHPAATADNAAPRKRRPANTLDAAVKRVAAANRRDGHSTKITTRVVDPALLEAWCAGCRTKVRPRLDGTCTTCGTQTGANLEETKPRRRRRRKPLKKDSPAFGNVCACGGWKSKQAHACRACSNKRRAGRKLGPRRTLRSPISISEELLLEARRLYATGLSVRQVADQIHSQTTYKTVASCAEGLYSLFKTRGWKLRPQAEVTAARNYKHGRRKRGPRTSEQEQTYRRWLAKQRGWTAISRPGNPVCAGVKLNHPNKGRPCRHRALDDSEFCYAHDPRFAADRAAITATMRANARYREPLLDAAPFTSWLQQLHARHGDWRAVGRVIGADTSMAHRWGTGRTRQVAERVVRRSLENAGVPIHTLYPDLDGEPLPLAA